MKVWADGPESFIAVFKDVLNYLSPVLGLEFEWAPTKPESDFVAYIGHTVAEAKSLNISCFVSYVDRVLGCANSNPNELGEVKDGRITVFNLWNEGSTYNELTPWAQKQTLSAIIHEAIHTLGSISHRSESDTLERGRLDVAIVLDRETYVISKYSMDRELGDETCGRYMVEAEDGQYPDAFEFPDAVRGGSDNFGNCGVESLGAVSGTVALSGTWIKHCRGSDSGMDGYSRSYGFSVTDWSMVRIEFTSNDSTSLHLSKGDGDGSAELAIEQDMQVYFSTDQEFIRAHWHRVLSLRANTS